ncbi:hypothetical protein NED98_21725 [Sphingomonas sp. MMSM20]|uniref:hypothetical protein n=1 Tax=Sphingomonas lycopersici TaxID=2951807 RepID=UPI00223737D0|nr:hypothetical protein [Sphingomonas lycopersici]MCW6532871.1 hypothetical protein [Sphingomonas lycopersici]
MRWLILSAAMLGLVAVEGAAIAQRGDRVPGGVVVAVPLDREDDAPPLRSTPLPPPVVRHAPDGATVTTSRTAPGYDVNADYYRDRSGATVSTQTARSYPVPKPMPRRKPRRRAR